MPQRVLSDACGSPRVGRSGELPRDAVAVEASCCVVAEERAFAAFADGEIDRACRAWSDRDDHCLAARAVNNERACDVALRSHQAQGAHIEFAESIPVGHMTVLEKLVASLFGL